VITASNGDTVSVNFGRVNGKRSTVCSQRIIGKDITFEVRGEGKNELSKMIADVNHLSNINNGNHIFPFPDSGWQGQRIVNRPDSLSNLQPCIAMDSVGNPWAVWVGSHDDSSLVYTKWSGINWDNERVVGPNAPGVWLRLKPSIAFDNENTAWLVWHNAYENNNRDIASSHWEDTCWSPEMQVNIPDSTELDFAPKIAYGGGQIWCVWYGRPNDASPDKIYASRWTGTGWTPDMVVSPPDGFDHWWCSIAVDNTGRPHVVWCEYPHYIVYYSFYNGSYWTNPVIINDTFTVRASPWADPRIAIDRDGNLHVSWTGALVGASHRDIFYSKYNGMQWSPAIKISQDSLYDEWYSDIAVDRANNIWISWDRQGEGSDQFRVYTSHFNGTSWSVETRLDDDTTSFNDRSSAVALDVNSDPWILWEGYVTYSSINIYYNRYINGGAEIEETINVGKNNQFFINALPTPALHYCRISYFVKTPSYVELKIYNINGECLKALVNEYKTEGEYTIEWNGKNFDNKEIRAGIYLCQLRVGQIKGIKKIILLR
jgi:hypothetical protein